MNLFDYIRPATVAEAVNAAAEPGAAYLAAGTNLLDLMKGHVTTPEGGQPLAVAMSRWVEAESVARSWSVRFTDKARRMVELWIAGERT